jgi:aryl-alcohol dehydrogenase-like predicted oxidoreductase
VLATAQADGIAFLAYAPLAHGVLAGKYLGSRHSSTAGNWRGLRQINSAIRTTLLPLARERDLTVAQLSLAWLLAQPGITAAVAGASSHEQLAENAAAASVRLEPSLVAAITAAFRGCNLRYRETLMQQLRRRAGRLKQNARERTEAWFK